MVEITYDICPFSVALSEKKSMYMNVKDSSGKDNVFFNNVTLNYSETEEREFSIASKYDMKIILYKLVASTTLS